MQNLSKSVEPGFGSKWSKVHEYHASSGRTITLGESIAGPTSTSSSSQSCHSEISFCTESANIDGSFECWPFGRIHMSWLPGT